MTCIVAVKDRGRVYMGGDSIGGHTNQWMVTPRKDPKVFWCGKLLIGYTSSYRMAQLIRFGLQDALPVSELEPPDDPADGFEFMVTDFVPRVRYLFDEGGYLKTDCGREEAGQFLVAWGGQLFGVEDDLQVADYARPWASCGCGIEYALGALHAKGKSQPLDIFAVEY